HMLLQCFTYTTLFRSPDMDGNVFTSKTETYLSKLGSNSQQHKLLPKDSILVSCIGTGGVVSINMFSSHTNQQINSIVLEDLQTRSEEHTSELQSRFDL